MNQNDNVPASAAPEKGCYGYRDAHRRRSLIISAVLLCLTVGLTLTGRHLSGVPGTVLTISGILFVLPFANVLSPLLTMLSVRTPGREQYDAVRRFSDRGELLYDLTFTSKEGVMPADAALIRPELCVLLCPALKDAPSKLTSFLAERLNMEDIHVDLYLYTDTEAFVKALDSLDVPAEGSRGEDDTVRRIRIVFLSLSY